MQVFKSSSNRSRTLVQWISSCGQLVMVTLFLNCSHCRSLSLNLPKVLMLFSGKKIALDAKLIAHPSLYISREFTFEKISVLVSLVRQASAKRTFPHLFTSWGLLLKSGEMHVIKSASSGSAPLGHGNRPMETQRCLLRDESFGRCGHCECRGKQKLPPR